MTAGVTLVELVVSLSLIGLLGLPTGRLIVEYLGQGVGVQDTFAAMQWARHEMERLDSLDDFFAPDLAIGAVVMPEYQGSPYTLTRTVTCATGDCVDPAQGSEGVKRIDIRASRGETSPTLAELTSYRTKHVDYGA